ncbi:pleckstrin homology domain-containing family G member 3-like isoform X2 [Pungitius pungitius]|uniref:pleckstrin homology domain-containing family G member 3-like isoform X2 n=1 Tax=Pungitius pungitius TaxID=134920 RepID=UPI002E13EC3B
MELKSTLSYMKADGDSCCLSAAPPISNERAPSASPSDSSDPRPASLISMLSSGSSRSGDLDLIPAGAEKGAGPYPGPDTKGRSDIDSKESTKRMPPNPQPTYLDRVVMEIIETERMYVRDLRMIVEDYLAHIIDQCDLSIRPEQVCSLFGNIEDIYEFNSELLQALDLCDNDPVAVARCFVLKSEYFEIYTQYCTNYPNSVASLTDCMRNKCLAKFFRDRQASLKRSLPLGSYLLKPVQRILKYHLLLQEIAKHFDPQEAGYEVVEEAIYTMTGVAWYINDMKRKHEHAVRLQEVQSLLLNWKGQDLTTYGELVLEGTFKVHRAKNERTLFLFERMLLITKRRGDHYVYKTHISCSTLMLIESAKDSLSFSVTHYKHPKQAHTVQAKSVEEKKLWAHHIKRIILENHKAVIPQKAKEAILEMDSIYAPRYRYSPERLKKALSCQSDEFPPDGRQGQRQSEPIQKTLKSSKVIVKEDECRVSFDSCEQKNGCFPEEEEPGETEPSTGQSSSDKQKKPDSEPTGLPESEPSDPERLSDPHKRSGSEDCRIAAPPQRSEEKKPEGHPESTEQPTSATTDSDSRTLSSAESSEDEEEAKEVPAKEGEAVSILPSSVLDKAGAIAQHFSSVKRSGSAPDEGHSLGSGSPRLRSQTGSFCAEPSADLTLLSPREDVFLDVDRGIRQRRDSALSKQDQLLIGKIRSYYENAESEDAAFSLQRRESLTYIPTGLVRSSVSRLNSIPKDEAVHTDPSSLESALPADTWGHMASTESLDSFKSDQRSTDPEDLEDIRWSRSHSLQENPSDDEEFRPSSEMITVWQTMEREIGRSQGDAGGLPRPQEVLSGAKIILPDTAEASSSSCHREESVSSSPPRLRSSTESRTGCLKEMLKVFGEEGISLRAPVLRVARLKSKEEPVTEDSDPLDDVDSKSKVLNLARRYSQRIKTTKPMVRQRIPGVLVGGRTLLCVEEEKQAADKPNIPHNQATSPPPNPVDPNRPVKPGRARSRSPLTPPTECFHWPDVRELRSRYSDQDRPPKSPVGRSLSIPEQLCDGGLRRRSSCSSEHLLAEGGSQERDERSRRLHRAKSLDLRPGGAHAADVQELQERVANGYYVAAEAALPGDEQHKILVMEKLPDSQSPVAEDDYVQIRSPTSREKISIMAVMDRCRVYQDSDEYRRREDGKTSSESSGRQDDQPKAGGSNPRPRTEGGQKSVVKSLREKFQSRS